MNFSEKNKVVGHLEIVKIDSRTGAEEVVFEDHNVITGGMGRTLTQLMTRQDCALDPCEFPENKNLIPDVEESSPCKPLGSAEEDEGVPCSLYHYQTSRFQVGTGASANGGDVGTEEASTVSLGQPLVKSQYGNSLMSVKIVSGNLYSEEDTLLERQSFGKLQAIVPVASSVVHIWALDEETANGTLLDEAGLFVHNPYLKEPSEDDILPFASPQINLSTGSIGGGEDSKPSAKYEPGHLLAAYKKFTPIKKENYFTLLFRWSLTFPTGF